MDVILHHFALQTIQTHLIRGVERVVHEPSDNRRLAHVLIAQKHQFKLRNAID